MGSTFGGINILSRSLYAQQAGLDTVGHNIANASTDGYSRQRVNMVTVFPTGEVYGSRGQNQAGAGVAVGSIMRARDAFTDRQLWKESSTLGYSQTSSEALSKMEDVFSEPSDTGVQTVLNKFWTAWQTLSTNASDSGARTTVAQQGVAVVNTIQHAAQQLKDTVENINSAIELDVKSINQITSNIHTLNQQIAFTEVGGNDHANDLRDSRDLLVDQLSKLVNISVQEDSSGKYTIKSGSLNLVNDSGHTELSTATTIDPTFGYEVTKVTIASNGSPVDFTNGEVKALLDSRDSSSTGIFAYMTSLDKVSKFLLQDFNSVHRSGYGTDNVSGRNFFGADSNTDYNGAGALADGAWLNAITVNHEITDSAAGLAILAAKTAANGMVVTASSTNTDSEIPSVTVTGTYTGGSTPTAVMVKVASLDGLGKVSGISYSTDGGTNWSSDVTGSSPYQLTLKGMTINIDTSSLSAPAINNTYNFSLSTSNNASGDNAILLGNSLKTDVSATLGNISLDAFYTSMIGGLGIQSQDAQRLYTNQQTVINHLTNLRASTSGVNMDEEMTDMIRFQKGYNAAARVLTAMDEMLDKLINGTGVVGR
ncbi:flagellar hook-associated protein FlgK [Desulfosporosinus meridiei]|uniref:Flagellar hook-associated protein 1 n=1 Tax=Desulfosporosinus meridiei (strain ATCC BAA-275 / DSM 13257 / KCTC 12902 / NCIMB 13706 / S10) TaxID=768704 RepID=J7J062_DESMD|nr:flagellar hook-associated protein FlgK [Desulfosporosinus meridiei]AFQ45769.1 flagellar hook-associated protein FlgK [Desulfosporosinus meridiei DSM 13257]